MGRETYSRGVWLGGCAFAQPGAGNIATVLAEKGRACKPGQYIAESLVMANQAGELSYAVRFAPVLKYFGLFCFIVAALAGAPLGVSVAFGETAITIRYAIVVFTLLACGGVLSRVRAAPNLQVNEAIILGAILFVFTPLVMSYPIMASGLGFVDALFEAISGATTTGLSTLSRVEHMPSTFLFARAWMQWYGGLGIVVLSLALVMRPGLAARTLAGSESMQDDLIGSSRAYARRALAIYAILTGAGIVLLLVARAGLFNAVVYSLAAVSTGGFAPHDNSLAGLGSWPVHTVVTLICLVGAVPLTFYYGLFHKGSDLAGSTFQLKAILICGGLVATLLGVFMWLSDGLSWRYVFSHAPFLAFSAQSTAGFSTIEPSKLDAASKLVLICAMVTGAGVGSTGGGFKILRLLIAIKCLQVRLARSRLARHAVLQPRLAGQRLQEGEIGDALLIILLFVAVIVVSWLAFLAMGYEPLDSLFEVASATGTVGLSVGLSSSPLPTLLKVVLCVDMLLGRLEIVAWLVLLDHRTWIGRRL